MKFLEDAQGFLEAGKYQEALDILDRRIKCVHEMPKSRLAEAVRGLYAWPI